MARRAHEGSSLPLSSFSESCWGKAMVAYTKPQQWKKEESERLRGERDQIKFINWLAADYSDLRQIATADPKPEIPIGAETGLFIATRYHGGQHQQAKQWGFDCIDQTLKLNINS